MRNEENDCLAYDPFQGDETAVRRFSDKMVITRKEHRCNICWEDFPAGSRARAMREVNLEERRTMTFYFCPPCCSAMARSWDSDDAGRAIEKRTAIGMRAAEAERKHAKVND
jgi:hypothetical protein